MTIAAHQIFCKVCLLLYNHLRINTTSSFMKKPVIIFLLLVSFTFTISTLGNGHLTSYRVGAAKITVWENEGPNGSTWENFEVDKLYKKNGQWHESNSFDESELLQLTAAIDAVINEQSAIKN